jgi:hypothetical protein
VLQGCGHGSLPSAPAWCAPTRLRSTTTSSPAQCPTWTRRGRSSKTRRSASLSLVTSRA